MANERTYPCLPTGDLDGSIAFYASLTDDAAALRDEFAHATELVVG